MSPVVMKVLHLKAKMSSKWVGFILRASGIYAQIIEAIEPIVVWVICKENMWHGPTTEWIWKRSLLRSCTHIPVWTTLYHQAYDVLTAETDLSPLRPTWSSGAKGIRPESLSFSFFPPAACVSAGHVTLAWLLGGPGRPQRSRGHWHHWSPLCPHTLLTAERWQRKGRGDDDVSEIIKRIDLCAAISRTMVDGSQLCGA